MKDNPFTLIIDRLDSIETVLANLKSALPVQSEHPNKPLRMREAAAYLGISIQTLYGHIMAGKIKPMKAGKFNLFYKADLDQFVQGGQTEPTDTTRFIKTKKPQL